jgi:hypothetical protein
MNSTVTYTYFVLSRILAYSGSDDTGLHALVICQTVQLRNISSRKVSMHASVLTVERKRVVSIPFTRLLHFPLSFSCFCRRNTQLNDNSDYNLDKCFSFELWYDTVVNDGL